MKIFKVSPSFQDFTWLSDKVRYWCDIDVPFAAPDRRHQYQTKGI